MLVNRFPLSLSPTNLTEGVLGRLVRALPARALPEPADRTDAVASDPAALATVPSTVPSTTAEPFYPLEYGLFAQIENWLWTWRQRDTERYLSQARDLCDLESRMRDLDRHHDRPYYTF
jgi:Protein of unknown function (DUF3563)